MFDDEVCAEKQHSTVDSKPARNASQTPIRKMPQAGISRTLINDTPRKRQRHQFDAEDILKQEELLSSARKPLLSRTLSHSSGNEQGKSNPKTPSMQVVFDSALMWRLTTNRGGGRGGFEVLSMIHPGYFEVST
jgi:hypothetical protein